MLIPEHRLIFIHIPKCAGRSVAQVFGCDFEHHTIHEYAKPEYSKMTRFTVVRNPWDRFVSMYHYLRESPYHLDAPVLGPRGLQTTFPDWLRANLDARQPDFPPPMPCGARHTHHELGSPFWFSSQLAWIGFRTGEVLVDRLIEFANLREEFGLFCADQGIDLELPHENRSRNRKPYQEYYDDDLQQLVSSHYENDIGLFEYAF